jgi:hypothetical protein
MSQIDYAKCDYCGAPLENPDEIATGLCDRHLKMISRTDHYIGVCWNCGAITRIEEIPRRLKRIFKDKYLFTKKCKKCSGKPSDNIQWVTFATFVPDHILEISPKGEIVEKPMLPVDKSKDRETYQI